jgi:hypothetical protein
MRTILKIATVLSVITVFALNAQAQSVEAPAMLDVTPYLIEPTTTTTIVPATFKHGDCSWVAPIALSVGWEKHQLPRLINIISRESGCCPRRIGGDVVDADCNVTRVARWNHRSDSGLLQINGVHWKRDHAQYAGLVCKKMKVCSQEPLLNPVTNLAAGRLIFDVVGWQAWTLSQP